jgi:hypothetical protein
MIKLKLLTCRILSLLLIGFLSTEDGFKIAIHALENFSFADL